MRQATLRPRLAPWVAGALALHAALLLAALLAGIARPPRLAEAPEQPATVDVVLGGNAPQPGRPAPQAPPAPPAPPPPAPASPPAPPPPPPAPDAAAQPAPAPRPAPPAPQAPKPQTEVNLSGGVTGPAGEITDASRQVRPARADTGNLPPIYPEEAGLRGEHGVVSLRMHVDELGLVTRVDVLKSSGYRSLDEAARRALRTWHFSPARQDGRPVRDTVDIDINFHLH